MIRNRFLYSILLIIVISLGLSTRKAPQFFPSFIAEYGGDTLWSLMFFLIFGLFFSKKSTLWVAILTLIFSYGIECSQLYQADWINQIRKTFPGAMLLGHGFLWSDFICYTLGVVMGYIIEKMIIFKK